ncbi:ATP-binding protein [Paraburkholderia dinghuensis]|uniref:histidine kinase n=1 Tax=Paraburkholderia dinghuensis TaxID=2305225 RepID=A0A3N6MQB5_9BURK|nr:ATP-binding protein [Paraburkholderia dinghuensis]RQG99840.1 HAMP domain-containing protein [Paraburkholderia dinghuensis]
MMSRSIRRRLSLTILSCVSVVWIVAVFSSFQHASREVQEYEDARLVEYAVLFARLDDADLDRFVRFPLDVRLEVADPAQPGSEEADSDLLPRHVLFEVLGPDGRVLASSVPHDAATLAAWYDGRPWPRTLKIDGVPWRLYALRDGETGRMVRVMVASNTESDLATDTAWQIVWPLLAALPVLATLLWYAIGRSLTPLKTLSATIRARAPDSLEPIGIAAVPDEVRTLVDAINRLLSQLRQSILRERSFTSDAAHELKTPLAAIKIQAQVALAANDPSLQRLAMQRVVQGVDRSARLAEQLLLLARLDEHERIPASSVAMDELVEEAVGRHVANAREKSIAVAVKCDGAHTIHADPVLIAILLDNLLDNAIKYGTPHGHIEISVFERGAMQCLAVRDDGPGVADDERARLTDRFYRGTGVQAPGSGLGLSIVERIARYFSGTVRFEPGLNGRGLAVVVEFPAADNIPPDLQRPPLRDNEYAQGDGPPA